MISDGFDIIGDIHGHADALIQLLKKLGYEKNLDGIFYHKSRQVVFLGDFIDRTPNQARVINIVKPMVENGYAHAVMGNHEFNAICFHTKHPKTKLPLREHSEKNQKQHQEFLNEYFFGSKEADEVINWFKGLPIYMEFDKFRVIHACWNKAEINNIESLLDSENRLINDAWVKVSSEGSKEFQAIEILLKGMEINLPDSYSFLDKDKNKRHSIRIKWWEKGAKTYRDYALVHSEAFMDIPDIELPDTIPNPEYLDKKPVLFGHYWFSGKPKILKTNAACLDYSIAKNDKLVAYQWNDGDQGLINDNLIWVDAIKI